MLLYTGHRVPNGRRVAIFLAEKQIDIPKRLLDLGTLEHRGPAFSALNPMQRVPALELDNGQIISESIAICRYFEIVQPDPALFGVGAEQQAIVEMWNRRVELHLYAAVSSAFRHLHPAMAEMEVPQIAVWGEANKGKAQEFLTLLDGHLADNEFVCGDAFSVADISGLVAMDFMRPAKISVPEGLSNLMRWHAAISARPSAKA